MDYLQYKKILVVMNHNLTEDRFKPCYKWITFNTKNKSFKGDGFYGNVLNLVINGLPSIRNLF